jgi:hypothetical protein
LISQPVIPLAKIFAKGITGYQPQFHDVKPVRPLPRRAVWRYGALTAT